MSIPHPDSARGRALEAARNPPPLQIRVPTIGRGQPAATRQDFIDAGYTYDAETGVLDPAPRLVRGVAVVPLLTMLQPKRHMISENLSHPATQYMRQFRADHVALALFGRTPLPREPVHKNGNPLDLRLLNIDRLSRQEALGKEYGIQRKGDRYSVAFQPKGHNQTCYIGTRGTVEDARILLIEAQSKWENKTKYEDLDPKSLTHAEVLDILCPLGMRGKHELKRAFTKDEEIP